MNSKEKVSLDRPPWAWLVVALLVLGSFYGLYMANIIRWRDSPDFGWRTMASSGSNIVADVSGEGEAAGLRIGDRIVAINGKAYTTFEELFFKVRNESPGSVNTYSVLRDGTPVEIRVTTRPIGIYQVLRRSGPIFLIGLIYTSIGILVVLMNPRARESWIFLSLCSVLGLLVSMGSPSCPIVPVWMYNVTEFLEVILPAPLIHMALTFPVRRKALSERAWLWILPYLFSVVLFVTMQMFSPAVGNRPRVFNQIELLYMTFSVLLFLGSTIWNTLRGSSIAVRLQSRVILVGITLGILVPLSDLGLRLFWKFSFFSDPATGFALCLVAFPLSIAYTIVKHDLFSIDTIVRRTYGYVLSTAAIIGTYAGVISLLNITFRSSEFSRSPLFSILFALTAVFLFRPMQERIQRFVDRLFYRQQYDYRKTIQSISEAMTSILDPKEIQQMLVGSVVSEMFLENGMLALQAPGVASYRVEFAVGSEDGVVGSREISQDEPLLKYLQGRSEPIFGYDVELDPSFEGNRESLRETFRAFASEAMLPLRYKDKLRGILSLGRKKSGKIFTREDLDLLKTISSQGAIALENAHLFQENLEKGRMDEELKIAHDIQVSMLPERAPVIEGLRIAARSVPAREVGGDFYDFVTVDGEKGMGKVAVVVGDVSGKAVSGALVMAASRSVFRVLTEANASVGEVMNRMNYRLHRDVRKGMFVAALYALLDSREKTLTLSNAGQTSPVLCPADGGPPVLIENEGDRFPLGIIEDCCYEETRVGLHSGDVVILYTDGVVEAVNAAGEMYGFERFLETVGKGRGLSAEAILETLLEDVARFVGGVEPHDDITILVAKVH